jgi:hypothetical protein
MLVYIIFLFLVSCYANIDYVIVAFDENADEMLNHLRSCVTDNDRVFVYLKIGGVRTHANTNGVRSSVEQWNQSTPFTKIVHTMPNSWCCDEAVGYLVHIKKYYREINNYTAFLHAHVRSWHSDDVCTIVQNGLVLLQQSKFDTQNINKPHGRRCISPRGIMGDWTSIELRNRIYENWKKWTKDENTPTRIVWDCCIQSIVKRQSIQNRSYKSWVSLLKHAIQNVQIPWEYIWPTLLDELWSTQSASC